MVALNRFQQRIDGEKARGEKVPACAKRLKRLEAGNMLTTLECAIQRSRNLQVLPGEKRHSVESVAHQNAASALSRKINVQHATPLHYYRPGRTTKRTASERQRAELNSSPACAVVINRLAKTMMKAFYASGETGEKSTKSKTGKTGSKISQQTRIFFSACGKFTLLHRRSHRAFVASTSRCV